MGPSTQFGIYQTISFILTIVGIAIHIIFLVLAINAGRSSGPRGLFIIGIVLQLVTSAMQMLMSVFSQWGVSQNLMETHLAISMVGRIISMVGWSLVFTSGVQLIRQNSSLETWIKDDDE